MIIEHKCLICGDSHSNMPCNQTNVMASEQQLTRDLEVRMINEEDWFDIRPPMVGDDQGLDYLGIKEGF